MMSAKDAATPREAGKTAQVIATLQRTNGATLPEIIEKMAGKTHSIRGFKVRGMKTAGFTVEPFKPERGERTYRINK